MRTTAFAAVGMGARPHHTAVTAYMAYHGDLGRHSIRNYFYEVRTKFDDCGTNFDELGTKYNPEVIKYRPFDQMHPRAARSATEGRICSLRVYI